MDRKLALILGVVGMAILAGWGPLDPPKGPITSTGKTLTEVEPRIALTAESAPGDATNLFKITKPGSYYLTGNITGVVGKAGIYIASSRVTLDLNGFTLEGVDGALQAVRVNADNGVAIRNGAAYNWKVGFDVLETNGGRLSNLSATANFEYGIKIGPGGIVTDCSATQSSIANFYVFSNATVTRCVARGGGATGFRVEENAVLNDCTASQIGTGFYLLGPAIVNNCSSSGAANFGFRAEESAVMTDCIATDGDSSGFLLSARCRLTRCHSRGNLEGFYINEGNSLVECTAASNANSGVRAIGNANTIERGTFHENGADGIYIFSGVGNSIDGNLCTYNKLTGVHMNAGNNLAVRNRARGNTEANFLFVANTDYGVILTNPGQGFTSSAAWANFAY